MLAEVESRRQDLGRQALLMRYRSGLEESFAATMVRCDSMADRLAELKDRLMGQINVVGANFRMIYTTSLLQLTSVEYDSRITSLRRRTARLILRLRSCSSTTVGR